MAYNDMEKIMCNDWVNLATFFDLWSVLYRFSSVSAGPSVPTTSAFKSLKSRVIKSSAVCPLSSFFPGTALYPSHESPLIFKVFFDEITP